jgi:peroxiredoxin
MALFAWGVIWQSKKIPASKGAPQVGQKAPDFTLPDTQGNVVTLSSLSGISTAAGVTGRASQWVLLIFYRGYW